VVELPARRASRLPDADRCLAQRMMIIIPFSGREPVFARTLRQTGFTGD